MTDFKETEHPRGTTGQFTEKPISTPEVALDLEREDAPAILFVTEHDGVDFEVEDNGNGYTAYADDGIDDALQQALEAGRTLRGSGAA